MRLSDDELLPTRASLLLRLKDWRDQVSWQRFFDTYWSLIYSVARRAGLSDCEAQDVVQETMLNLAKQLPTFQYDPAHGQFKGWLLNLTRWRIMDQLRKRSKAFAREATEFTKPGEDHTRTKPLDQIADPSSNALDAMWEAEWQDTLFQAALASVKRRVEPQNYQIFDFYVNKEWAAAKVASTFNVTVAQVHLTKHRVITMLRQEVTRLEREGA